VNNVVTHRIEVDPVRGPFVTRLFELYATGEYSLKTITRKAYEIGLRHPRADRRMTKSEIHRMLQRLVYTGEFVWKGTRYAGSHQPLVPCETFDAVQATLGRKPRARYPKQRHAFMGLLTCARCGCAMTAEKKKGKYVYYRCTGYKGACGDEYVREERLADLLGEVIRPIQIPSEVADEIATALRATDSDAEQRRCESLRQLEQRRRTILSKLDRGYEDRMSGQISEEFWLRKSAEWEEELAAVDAQRPPLEDARPLASTTGEKILELAKKAEILYKSQNPVEQRRLLETVLSNCAFDR
jgi:site-specific DNA recombinase